MLSISISLVLWATLVWMSSAAPLWPIPSHYSLGDGVLWLSEKVPFHYSALNRTEFPDPTTASKNVSSTSAFVEGAIQRARHRIFTDQFTPWKFHPRNSDFEPKPDAPKISISSVIIQQNKTDPLNVYKPSAGLVDESYTLSISTSGRVLITSASSIGILHALETFTQLFYQHSSNAGVYTPYAPVVISDAPKFPHRGLNLDVSRNYYTPLDIMRTVDALSWNKFNRLHLHLTDAQSWPVDIPALPELSTKGAYMKGLSYSPKVLAEIQQYGADRGIEVIIEIDMPGHTSSIALSYPDLICAFNVQPDWSTYSAEPPTGQLKLNNSAVYDFLDTLWTDLLPRILPYSTYFHTGGDEVNANAYLLDEGVQSNDSKVLQPLLQDFLDYNHAKLRAAGLTPMVWEEQLLQWNLTLGADVVVQTWQSDEALAQTVAKGHKALAGNYNYWYLDCGHGQWLDFYPSNAAEYYPFEDYCGPFHNWRLVYSYDPLSGVPHNLSHLVLGGEVHMWSEQTDPVNLDDNLWPRASAAGEVLWSGAKDAQGQNRSQVEASPRLSEMRERMVQRGIKCGPIQMIFCTQNGTQCAEPAPASVPQ